MISWISNVALVLVAFGQGPASPGDMSTAERIAANQVKEQLLAAVDAWGDKRTDTEKASCGALIDQYLRTASKTDADAYYLGAKVAEVVGLEEKSMDILREAIAQCSKDKTPGLSVSVSVTANMWLGRLARDKGLLEEAIDSYRRAAEAATGETKQIVGTLCSVYEGEIEAGLAQDTERARKTFEQSMRTASLMGRESEPKFYSALCTYMMERLSNAPTTTVCPATDMLSAIVGLQSSLNGLTLDSGDSFRIYGTKRNGLQMEHIKKFIGGTKSSVDKQFAQLVSGMEQADAKNWDEVEALLAPLCASSDFLAPAAGLQMALCYEKQGNRSAAEKKLDEIAARWPNSEWPAYVARVKRQLRPRDTGRDESATGSAEITVGASGGGTKEAGSHGGAGSVDAPGPIPVEPNGSRGTMRNADFWITALLSGVLAAGAVVVAERYYRKRGGRKAKISR